MKPRYVLTKTGPVLKHLLGTPCAEALERLRETGLCIPAWAKANGFQTATVKALLYGRTKGTRGESHRAAIALGLKDGVVVSAKGFMPHTSNQSTRVASDDLSARMCGAPFFNQ